jgi:hypothetical protein
VGCGGLTCHDPSRVFASNETRGMCPEWVHIRRALPSDKHQRDVVRRQQPRITQSLRSE